MPDEFASGSDTSSDPARNASVVTPHATDPLGQVTKALYIGGAGTVVCRLVDDAADVTFNAVPAGTILPVRAAYVRATSTATDIVALF